MQWQRSRPLGLNALGLYMVAIQRQQHADGVVVGSTQHKGRTPLCQRHQQVVGVGQAVGIGNDGSNVIQRDLPQLFALAFRVFHHHEAAVHKQVPSVVCDFDDAAYHGGQP